MPGVSVIPNSCELGKDKYVAPLEDGLKGFREQSCHRQILFLGDVTLPPKTSFCPGTGTGEALGIQPS